MTDPFVNVQPRSTPLLDISFKRKAYALVDTPVAGPSGATSSATQVPLAALADPCNFDIFPVVDVSVDEIDMFVYESVLWSPTTGNKDLLAGSTEILKTPFVEKVMAQVNARVPAGYSIFNLFARLADKDSKVQPHQDAPSFNWRYVVRFSTAPVPCQTSIDFHLSGGHNSEVFQHKIIPANHGYLASRMVMSKNGVGLYHSVTPNIDIFSTVLQISLVFDVSKTTAAAPMTPIKLLQEIPHDVETMSFGGKHVYLVEPARRISAIASARGKIGGKMGDKVKKAAGGSLKGKNTKKDPNAPQAKCANCKSKVGTKGNSHLVFTNGKRVYCGRYNLSL